MILLKECLNIFRLIYFLGVLLCSEGENGQVIRDKEIMLRQGNRARYGLNAAERLRDELRLINGLCLCALSLEGLGLNHDH